MSSHDPDSWRERAESLRRAGKLEEAMQAGRRAVQQAPEDPLAWSELAHALRLGGILAEAKSAAARAIELDPGQASAWFNWGAVLLAQGDAAGSVEANRRAVGLDPKLAEAWSNLGGALAASGDAAGEIDAYRRALDVNAGLAPVWSNLGHALRLSGQSREAVAACRKATELDPAFAPAWINLANALVDSGEREAAIAACESALRLGPGLAESWGALAGALHAARRLEEALQAHRKAVELQPGNATLHFNLGVTLQHCGRSAEAIPPLRRALELEPAHAEAHFELSLALLATGQLREGWHEYEWRWRRQGAEPKRHDFALWDGDTSRPRRVLLWDEQGIGDQILHGSMVTDLESLAPTVTLEIDRRLVPLFQRSFPQIAVVPQGAAAAAGRTSYDCQAPLGSLGRWLRPSFASFPGRRSFLVADGRRAGEYRRRLARAREVIVGISWRSANKDFGPFKSMSLGDWLEILRAPRVRFIDLQYGDTAAERAEAERSVGARLEHLPDLDLHDDLEGLAALCGACDLVMTSSNVTAHVAGALGRPAWLILPKGHGRFWYWFSDRSDSPWYPSVRIFDQVVPGSWREILEVVARELAAFVKAR